MDIQVRKDALISQMQSLQQALAAGQRQLAQLEGAVALCDEMISNVPDEDTDPTEEATEE